MFFLVGERVHGAAIDAGDHACPVCGVERHFHRIVETNYFCIFGLRLVPIEKVADYFECDSCKSSFNEDLKVPSALPVVHSTIVYVLVGYGMQGHPGVAREICEKVTGSTFPEEALTGRLRAMDAGTEDLFDTLRDRSRFINVQGKRQIIEAAFLMTHVCCEIQFEDKLRINLIGNALGVSLQYVDACIEGVRSQGYFGVRRLLQAQPL